MFLFQAFHSSLSISSPRLSSSPPNTMAQKTLTRIFSEWYLVKYPTTSKMKHLRRTGTLQQSFSWDQNENPQNGYLRSLISNWAFQHSSLSQSHLKGASLYLIPTKDTERIKKPQEFSMGWNGCSSSGSALTLCMRGAQVCAFMSNTVAIQERVTESMMHVSSFSSPKSQ